MKVHVENHVNHDTRVVLEKFLSDLYVDDTETSYNSIADASKFYRITSSCSGMNLQSSYLEGRISERCEFDTSWG